MFDMLSEGKVGEKNAYRKGEEERYVKIGRGTAESVFAHQVVVNAEKVRTLRLTLDD